MIKITDVRSQNRKALYELLHVDDLRKEYANALNSMSYLGAQNIDGMPHGTGVGNPTMQKAMKLTDIEAKKNWIMAIEQMEGTLNEKQMAFLHIRRKAEKEAIRRGCHHVHLDTMSWQAPEFYKKHGYEVIAILPDIPTGNQKYLLMKAL